MVFHYETSGAQSANELQLTDDSAANFLIEFTQIYVVCSRKKLPLGGALRPIVSAAASSPTDWM